MKIDIGEVLTRAWQISWKNKGLWGFGSVLVLLSFLLLPLMFAPVIADLVMDQNMDKSFLLLTMIGGFVIYFLVIFLVGTLLNIALTQGILHAEHGDKKRLFMELISESYPFFWRYLGTTALFVGGMILVIALFSILTSLISLVTFGLGMLCMLPLSFLQYPLMLIWYVCMEQALTAVVVDNMNAVDATKYGWQLFKKNIWVFVLVGLVFYFGMSMISSVVMVPFMFPFFFLSFGLEAGEFGNTILIISSICIMMFMPVFLLFQGGVMAFMKSGWVLTYLRLTRPTESQPVLQEATV